MTDKAGTKFKFGEEFQKAVLQKMLTDEAFMLQSVSYLKPNYFKDKYLSWVFETINEYWAKYQAQIDYKTIKEKVRLHEVEAQPAYMAVVDSIITAEPFDSEFLRDQLEKFVLHCKLVNAHIEIGEKYRTLGWENALDYTRTVLDDLNRVSFRKQVEFNFSDIEDCLEQMRTGGANAVPTGIIEIDRALGGGLPKGSLTVLLGATNSGKSMSMANILYHAVVSGKKALYLLHQDREAETAARFMSRFAKIPITKLLYLRHDPKSFTEEELQRIKTAKQLLVENVCLLPMRGTNTTIEEVRDRVILKMKEFKFDLLIDDYAQLLRTQRDQDMRFRQADVHYQFQKLCQDLDVPGLTVVQSTREGQKLVEKGTDHLRMGDISESFEIPRLADIVISISRSEEMERQGIICYYLVKQKYFGKKNFGVWCLTDFNCCLTHDAFPQGSMPSQGLFESVDKLKENGVIAGC